MPKKTITITLHVSELIYDIQSNTHLTADSKQERSPEQIATMKANDDEESLNRLMRSIGNAYASIKNQLSEYIGKEQRIGDNIQLDPEGTISLNINKLPSNYNEAVTDTIASAAHQYIVNISLMDWFLITSPSDAGEYSKLADLAIREIRSAINKRVRPERKPVSKS